MAVCLQNTKQGVSLIEIMIVVAILLLLISVYFGVTGQLGKGRDAKRKDDLERIRVAFEDYFNDHGCYPNVDLLANCNGEELKPYLAKIPCDPVTNEQYWSLAGTYVSGCNAWYKVYTFLENVNDPAIGKLGLSKTSGRWQTIGGESVNYGVSSPNVAVGAVPPTTFVCPQTGEPAPGPTTCRNPADMIGDCATCGCSLGLAITQGPGGFYCCPDESCQ